MKRRRMVNRQEESQGACIVRLPVDEIAMGVPGVRSAAGSDLTQLSASIARHGLLSLPVVRRDARSGRYLLVCGARRLAACRMLGMKQIDALLIPADAQQAIACYMEEHLTREAPCFLDEAKAIASAGEADVTGCFALSAAQLAQRTAMLALDAGTQDEIRRGGLSLAQAQPLLCISDEVRRQEAASIIAARGLGSMQAKRLVGLLPQQRQENRMQSGRRRAIKWAIETAQCIAQELMHRGVGTSVSVHSQERGLCIQIMLKNEENLAAKEGKTQKLSE